jgi:hypothetical protein
MVVADSISCSGIEALKAYGNDYDSTDHSRTARDATALQGVAARGGAADVDE